MNAARTHISPYGWVMISLLFGLGVITFDSAIGGEHCNEALPLALPTQVKCKDVSPEHRTGLFQKERIHVNEQRSTHEKLVG